MSSEGSPPIRNCINLPRKAKLPFSDAVLVGDTLYISGRIGIDPATGIAPASIDEELQLLFDEFEAVLAQANMTMDDLVSVQIFAPAQRIAGHVPGLLRVSRSAPGSQ